MISNKLKAQSKKRQSFGKGAFIMTVGMLLVKILGAIFKIPLSYILGGEGGGYFNSAYSLYNPIYALATAGLPIAVSRMVSENIERKRFKDVRNIHKVSVPMFLLTGIIGFIIMIIGSFTYANITKAPDSIYSMFMLAPTVLFSCLISIYKGYFEGLHNMTPTATSELVEALGKVIFGLGIAYFIKSYGMQEYLSYGTVFNKSYPTKELANSALLPYASAGAVLGISLGAVLGYLYIYIVYKIRGDQITKEELSNSPKPYSKKIILKALLNISIPIGLGAIIMNIAGTIDAVLIQRRLFDIMQFDPITLLNKYKGLIPVDVVTRTNTHIFLSGCYGYVSTITMLIPSLTQGLSISALPSVTAAWTRGIKSDISKSINHILKVSTILSFPAGLGLSVLSYPIMDLLYNTFGKGSQPGEIYIESQILYIAGIATIFVSVSTPICSMLQAIGRPDLPLKILTVGMILKIFLNYVLVGNPMINIQGAGIGTLICYLIICVLGLYFLCREAKIKLNFNSILVKPIICSIMCAVTAYTFQRILSNFINYKLSTLAAILIAAVVYGIMLFVLKSITEKDLNAIPFANRCVPILKKFGLV